MRYRLLFGSIIFLIIGCNKDKFTIAPQLKFKSVNSNKIDIGNVLQMTLSFTDREGDTDSLFIQKITPSCIASNYRDSFQLPVDLPKVKDQQGDIVVAYGYRVANYAPIKEPQCLFNDTCYFRFVLQDIAGHKSDTINSPSIVIIKH